MYKRESNGYEIRWAPDDEELAEQVMDDLKGKGVPRHVTLPDDAEVPLEADVARKVRQRYRELHREKYPEQYEDDGTATE